MKTITILSGKGGVGKSSIAASLAVLLARNKKIVAVDCDVDAANLALIIGVEKFKVKKEISTNYKAFLDEKKCNSCKKCLDICAFSAISWNKKKNKPEINKFLCEGCGACGLICPENAFELKKVKNAVVSEADTKYGFPLVSAQLKMGESGSGNVVDEIKMLAEKKPAELMVVDSAPGIGCPVIASVRGSDYVIAITEPTPSGLSDLKRVLELVNYFSIPYDIIINRWDLNKKFSEKIEHFAKKIGVKILSKIPYDRKFVEAIVNMQPLVVYDKSFEKLFADILSKISI